MTCVQAYEILINPQSSSAETESAKAHVASCGCDACKKCHSILYPSGDE